MVAKLSSARIMEAASLDTSVPVMPMATPISAFFRAGASLTPSPVMDTMFPFRCQALTMRILCSGDTRAYTEIFSSRPSRSASVIWSSSRPDTASSPSRKIPSWRAMAEAVTLWSPVIMMVRMPPRLASATAWMASGRGGSIMEIRPMKVNSFSSSRVRGRTASSSR